MAGNPLILFDWQSKDLETGDPLLEVDTEAVYAAIFVRDDGTCQISFAIDGHPSIESSKVLAEHIAGMITRELLQLEV